MLGGPNRTSSNLVYQDRSGKGAPHDRIVP